MLCLGCDPDLHDLAIASWDDQGPVRAHVVHVPRVKGRVENEAVLAMMTALSGTLPEFGRVPKRQRARIWSDEFGETHIERPEVAFDVPDWCAVEAQELARGRGAQHRRPQDIVTLGQVAGMALMRVARGYLHGCGLYFPKPSEWKGSVPKHAMQGRLYTELGWGYDVHGKGSGAYCVPLRAPAEFDFGAAWRHVGDALLLARWCWEQASERKWKRVG